MQSSFAPEQCSSLPECNHDVFRQCSWKSKGPGRCRCLSCCEKWLEHLRSGLRRNARTRVGNGELNPRLPSSVETAATGYANSDFSGLPHCVDTVTQEICDKLTNFARYGVNFRVLPNFGTNIYCPVSSFVGKNRDEGIESRSYGHATRALSLAVEAESLFCQMRNAL